jgi:hypothetical protein
MIVLIFLYHVTTYEGSHIRWNWIGGEQCIITWQQSSQDCELDHRIAQFYNRQPDFCAAMWPNIPVGCRIVCVDRRQNGCFLSSGQVLLIWPDCLAASANDRSCATTYACAAIYDSPSSLSCDFDNHGWGDSQSLFVCWLLELAFFFWWRSKESFGHEAQINF